MPQWLIEFLWIIGFLGAFVVAYFVVDYYRARCSVCKRRTTFERTDREKETHLFRIVYEEWRCNHCGHRWWSSKALDLKRLPETVASVHMPTLIISFGVIGWLLRNHGVLLFFALVGLFVINRLWDASYRHCFACGHTGVMEETGEIERRGLFWGRRQELECRHCGNRVWKELRPETNDGF